MSDGFRAALGRTAECPTVEALAETPRRPEIVRHMESCAHCQAELALLHEFESAEPAADEIASVQWIESELRRRQVAPSPRHTVWERLAEWWAAGGQRAWVAVAASLFVLVAAGVYTRQDGAPRTPSTSDGMVWRSGKFAVLGPVGEVAAGPAEFRWEAVAGAANYRIQLMEVDHTVVWTTSATLASVGIPDHVRAQFKPGRTFEWQVVAQNATGEQLAATDLQSFHIALTRP